MPMLLDDADEPGTRDILELEDNLLRLEDSSFDDENMLMLLNVSDELVTADILELEDNLLRVEESISDDEYMLLDEGLDKLTSSDENILMLLDDLDELGT